MATLALPVMRPDPAGDESCVLLMPANQFSFPEATIA
jgi:hypothetical protein